MTKQVHEVEITTALSEIARMMRDQRIGDVLVTGIVTVGPRCLAAMR